MRARRPREDDPVRVSVAGTGLQSSWAGQRVNVNHTTVFFHSPLEPIFMLQALKEIGMEDTWRELFIDDEEIEMKIEDRIKCCSHGLSTV